VFCHLWSKPLVLLARFAEAHVIVAVAQQVCVATVATCACLWSRREVLLTTDTQRWAPTATLFTLFAVACVPFWTGALFVVACIPFQAGKGFFEGEQRAKHMRIFAHRLPAIVEEGDCLASGLSGSLSGDCVFLSASSVMHLLLRGHLRARRGLLCTFMLNCQMRTQEDVMLQRHEKKGTLQMKKVSSACVMITKGRASLQSPVVNARSNASKKNLSLEGGEGTWRQS